tara:strand:+ start:1012 stop:1152 length:141 start_codon:yes stop_codon:yes gene_type:complete
MKHLDLFNAAVLLACGTYIFNFLGHPVGLFFCAVGGWSLGTYLTED